MRHRASTGSSLLLEGAPLLARLEGSVLRSAAVDDAASADAEIQALVDSGALHADEAALALSMPVARRGTFVAGRRALREALGEALRTAATDPPSTAYGIEHSSAPILRTGRGAPSLPEAVSGSITHKQTLALAVIAPRPARAERTLQFVGVDLEHRPAASELTRPSIARRILTAGEQRALQDRGGDALAQRESVRIHFALKEAVYKAIDPFVHRYVRFTEVELAVRDPEAISGETPVTLLLPELAGSDIRVEAQWHLDGDWIVATAFSTRPPEAPPLPFPSPKGTG